MSGHKQLDLTQAVWIACRAAAREENQYHDALSPQTACISSAPYHCILLSQVPHHSSAPAVLSALTDRVRVAASGGSLVYQAQYQSYDLGVTSRSTRHPAKGHDDGARYMANLGDESAPV